jgi:TonB family protein
MRTRSVLVIAFLLVAHAASAQESSRRGPFVTGECPGNKEPALNWATVTTEPDIAPRLPANRPVQSMLPRYPSEMYRDGYRGRIVLSMVIDTTGRVVAGTVSIIESTDEVFSRWGCNAASRLKFEPARVKGRPVAVLWSVPFSFSATADWRG